MPLQNLRIHTRNKVTPKVVTAKQAKDRLGAMMEWAVKNRNEVIVETFGEPKAVIVSFDEYQKLSELREDARRRLALETLRKLREEVRARNQDITTEEQALEIAEEISQEFVNGLVGKGKIKFAPKD